MEIDNHALRSYDSIAHELGITRRAVIETEQRALRKLRKAFTKWGVYKLKDGRDSVLEGG
jgi:DNA-directed RNA polymerase sigma subunit (sigma70/sigma32)